MKTSYISSQKKHLLTTTTVLIAMLLSSIAMAGGKHHSNIDWARVTKVEPIVRTIEHRTPEKECWREQVRYEQFYDPDRSYTGTILGGIIGGAIGNAVGHKKKNKQVGTAVGAVLGASIGNDMSTQHRSHRKPTPHYRSETRCEVTEHVTYEEEVVGYHVWYRYRGEKYKTRMDHKPGKKIKVRVSVKPI